MYTFIYYKISGEGVKRFIEENSFFINKSKSRSNFIRLILFLGLSLSIIFIFSGSVNAATITIQPNNSTIQAAINSANDGDTIDLSAGTYNEHDITVNKSLTIIGPTVAINSTPTAVIDSQEQGRAFYIVTWSYSQFGIFINQKWKCNNQFI